MNLRERLRKREHKAGDERRDEHGRRERQREGKRLRGDSKNVLGTHEAKRYHGRMKRRILVTGFAAWAEHETNPSTALALALNGLTSGELEFIAKAPLPVEFEHAERAADEAAIALGAFAHVAFGLAASSPFIRIERVGRNRSTTTVPDNAGVVACDTTTLKNAPDALGTLFDTDAFVESLIASGFDARLSDDAGGYVCNDLYFRALARAARPTLFVHVPTDVMRLVGLPEALAEAIAKAVPLID